MGVCYFGKDVTGVVSDYFHFYSVSKPWCSYFTASI